MTNNSQYCEHETDGDKEITSFDNGAKSHDEKGVNLVGPAEVVVPYFF